MRRVLLPAVLVLAAATSATSQEPLRPVKTLVLEAGDSMLRRQFFGNVVARQTVDLAFQVAGQIEEFPVVEGSSVEEGALIARLDLEPFELALSQAEVRKRQADRDLARLEQLSSDTVSRAALDDARSAAELAAFEVRDAEYALEHATLHAPFDGIIASREVANYTTVQAGTPIVRIHDMSEWRVEIGVPEVLFRLAGEDPELELWGSFSGSDRRIPLAVREFNAEASRIGQTFTITLAMLGEPGPGVLPGSSITVIAGLEVDDARLDIPTSAVVVGEDGGTSVMVFKTGEGDTGTVHRQDITLSTGPDGEFRIESGVSPGDEVVVAGANALEDGQSVRRFTGFAN